MPNEYNILGENCQKFCQKIVNLGLAVVLRIADVLISRRPINSVGAKSNDKSKNMPKMDINNPASVAEALAHYKDLDD